MENCIFCAIAQLQFKLKRTSNKEHDKTPVKYLNVLHHNRSTLDMSGHFDQKRYCQLAETLMFICMQKMKSIPNFFYEIL